MTWQRIDEKTSIDDTLVTGAEYQLFIDEMRNQGKYYQPDHWTSYQLPNGQAREPILGVRHSDAVAFCEWLMQKENHERYFLLPTKEEVQSFPLRPFWQHSIGYWLNEETQFTWIGPDPIDAREISIDALNFACNRERTLNLYQALKRGREGLLRGGQIRNLNRSVSKLSRSKKRALVKFQQEEDVRVFVEELGLSLIRDLEQSLDRDLDRIHERALALNRAFDLAYAIGIDHNRSQELSRARNRPVFLNPGRQVSNDVYIEIFTLQERLAGRSPIFEGIRLARKERVR
jgi:hypothetical protein